MWHQSDTGFLKKKSVLLLKAKSSLVQPVQSHMNSAQPIYHSAYSLSTVYLLTVTLAQNRETVKLMTDYKCV